MHCVAQIPADQVRISQEAMQYYLVRYEKVNGFSFHKRKHHTGGSSLNIVPGPSEESIDIVRRRSTSELN